MARKKTFVPQPAIDRAGRFDGRRPILISVVLLIIGGVFLSRGLLARYVVTFRLPQTTGEIVDDPRLLSGLVVNQQVTTSNEIVEARLFDREKDAELVGTIKDTAPTAADDCLT